MTEVCRFFVPGLPQTKGSARAYTVRRKGGRIGAAVTNDNDKAKGWQRLVAIAARSAMGHREPLSGAVRISMRFQMQRPASVKAARRPMPVVKPDLDKLARCAIDGLTNVVVRDDAQIVGAELIKVYDSEPGVVVAVWEVEP